MSCGARWFPMLLAAWCFIALAPASADEALFGISIRSETLETRFHRQRNEQAPVATTILDASVSGTQSTATETRLRVVPDESAIRFEVINSGDVSSQTTGVNNQALVESTGRHHFEIIKPVWFDGQKFLTQHGHGTIQASTTPNRVISAAGARMPLLGQLGDRVAWNEVLRRQPQIDRAAAEDVSRDVLPKVDKLVDADFAKLGRDWNTLRSQVHTTFGEKLAWSATSSETAIRLVAGRVTPANRTNLEVVSALTSREDEDVVLCVAESAVNELARRHLPGGLRFTDSQLLALKELVEDADKMPTSLLEWQTAFADLLTGASATASLFEIEFAPDDPVQVQFRDGDIRFVTKYQVHPKLGAASGWMTTTFNLRGKSLPGDEWTVVVRSVDVGDGSAAQVVEDSRNSSSPDSEFTIPNDRETDSTQPATDAASEGTEVATNVETGTVWPVIIRNAVSGLASQPPVMKWPLEVDGRAIDEQLPRVRLVRIESSDGVLRTSLRVVDRPAVASRDAAPTFDQLSE